MKSKPPYAQALKGHITCSPLKIHRKAVICIIRTATTRVITCHSEEKLYFDEESLLLSCVQGKDSSLTLFVQNDSGLRPLLESKAFFHSIAGGSLYTKQKAQQKLCLNKTVLFYDCASIRITSTLYTLSFSGR